MARLFGTDGVRGVANRDLSPELAFSLGFAAAHVLAEHAAHHPVIVVGMDTRVSCDMLGAALMAGITSAGADVLDAGVIPTPGVAWLTQHLGADAGAMISASHNSYEYNGIKLFSKEGFKLPDETEDEIEAFMQWMKQDGMVRPSGEDVGKISRLGNASSEYEEHLLSGISLDLSGKKYVVDCANGASYRIAPRLLKKLGASVCEINVTPDGCNINRHCGSTHLEGLVQKVTETGADMGIAFDGDADRLMLVDETGEICDGDVIMAILARDLDRGRALNKKTVVATIMSNLGLERMTVREGLRLVRTAVGDRYVLQRMLEEGYSLGGEQSGHIILLDHATTGDGMLSLFHFLQAMSHESSGARLSEVRRIVEVIPQLIRNIRVENAYKTPAMEHPEVYSVIEGVKRELGLDGRVVVRASGTEPLIRVMLEGFDHDQINACAERIAGVINHVVHTLEENA